MRWLQNEDAISIAQIMRLLDFNIHKKNALVLRNPSFCQLELSNHNWYGYTKPISRLSHKYTKHFFPAVKKSNTPNRAEITFVHDGSDVWLRDIYHVSVNVLSTAPCLGHASPHSRFQPQPTTSSLTKTAWKATNKWPCSEEQCCNGHMHLVTCKGVSKYLCTFLLHTCMYRGMFVYILVGKLHIKWINKLSNNFGKP